MKRMIGVLVSSLCLVGCATDYVPYESGKFWCNQQSWSREAFDQTHREVAKRGYLYALAGALALQQVNPEGDSHYFRAPERLHEVDRPERDASGFEVATFELYSHREPGKLDALIIAFTGSNDSADWVWTNLLLDKSQYELAERYVQAQLSKDQYRGVPVVVTGYSLGGGLAAHVARQPAISSSISEVWLFNPSPKTYAEGSQDKRIWMAATRGEVLSILRWPVFRIFPGVNDLGVPPSQKADDYYLVKANKAYSHFRWVLARNMLFAADLAMEEDDPLRDEPMQILKMTSFDACTDTARTVTVAKH